MGDHSEPCDLKHSVSFLTFSFDVDIFYILLYKNIDVFNGNSFHSHARNHSMNCNESPVLFHVSHVLSDP